MLDFHTILLPKNRRTSKISRRQKGWNIRIPETEESHTFFFFLLQLGHRFQGAADQNTGSCTSQAPRAGQHWGCPAQHPKGAPRGRPHSVMCTSSLGYLEAHLGVTQPALWPFGEREKERNTPIRKAPASLARAPYRHLTCRSVAIQHLTSRGWMTLTSSYRLGP